MKKKTERIIILLASLAAVLFLAVFIAKETFPLIDFSDYGKLKIVSVTKTDIKKHVWPSQNKIDIDSVTLFVIPNLAEEKITGIETIRGRKRKGVDIKINLSDNVEVSCLKLNGKAASYVHVNGHLIVGGVADDTLFTLKLKYATYPNGGLFFAERKGEKYVYSVNEPIFAPEWFACNDTPRDKFYLSFSARSEKDATVISNGKKTGEKILGKEKITTWKTSYPVASYSVAFYLGNYNATKKTYGETNIEVYSFPDEKGKNNAVAALAKFSLHLFSEKFGDYPFPKDKFAIIETAWNYGGMENQTAIGIGEKFFSPEYFKEIFVHETAHEWFGNCVSVADWDDVWINEGLATFCEALYWEAVAGKNGYEAAVKSFRAVPENAKIRGREKNLFARVVYDKGAFVFYELRKTLGDEKFFNGLKKYVAENKYSSVNFTVLKNFFDFDSLDENSGKSILY